MVSNEVACEVAQVARSTDAVEEALTVALQAAAIGGRFDVVAQLASELQARRIAREAASAAAVGNVVDMAAARKARG